MTPGPLTQGPVIATRSNVVTLRDGRVIGTRDYGVPVIALHGTPGSRHKYASAHPAAVRLGLRLISIDRWGYGLSSPRPGGTLSDYGRDIAELADKLGLAQFKLVGLSGGAPFAVAVACTIPERVTALALVSPVGQLSGKGVRPGLSPFHYMCFRILPYVPGAVPAAFQMFRFGLRIAPGLALTLSNSRAQVDRLTARDPAVRDRMAKTFSEGLEPGVAGPRQDMALLGRPWGLDLSRAVMPSRIWLGTADRNVPLDAARALAADLPNCNLVEIDGAGHLWVSHNSGEVMSWLARV